jgi:hypothetical protein
MHDVETGFSENDAYNLQRAANEYEKLEFKVSV